MTRPTAKVAICQICSTEDVAHNLNISETVIRDAVKAGAKACFLPEASDFIVPTTSACYSLSQPLTSHTYTLALQALAKELGVWIVVGIHELPGEDEDNEVREESKNGLKVFNTYVAIGPDGKVKGSYRKIHLFDVALKDAHPSSSDSTIPSTSTQSPAKKGESDRMLAGKTILPPINTHIPGIGPIGLEICYDLRFPEMHQVLVDLGAKVICFPSAFTLKTGKDHWATLLRAIAIQFQVYVLAPAQAGTHSPTRVSWGESLAFSPWGTQLGRLESVEHFEARGEDREKQMPSSFFVFEMDEGLVE